MLSEEAVFLKTDIADLVAKQIWLRKTGKGRQKSTRLSFALSFNYALLEFLVTGQNLVHKGRLPGYYHVRSGSRQPPIHKLVEEIKDNNVRMYCRRQAEKYLTHSQFLVFFYGVDRRTSITEKTNAPTCQAHTAREGTEGV